MLTYKNDPLLLGKETANELIERGKTDLIFLDRDREILNLYSALVKKDDFVKKDKIVQPLQKTIYIKISQRWMQILNNRYTNKKGILKKFKKVIFLYVK